MANRFALWQVIQASTFRTPKNEEIKIPTDLIDSDTKYLSTQLPGAELGIDSCKGANPTYKKRN